METNLIGVADLEIVSAQPTRSGFTLWADGRDGGEYRIDMTVDVPMKGQTKAIVGELLAQSEWRIWRKVREPLRSGSRRKNRASTDKETVDQ
jgi:hypothetical protein